MSVLTQEDTVIAIQTIDRAINQISQTSRLGAIQNRMQHNIDNLMSQVMQTEPPEVELLMQICLRDCKVDERPNSPASCYAGHEHGFEQQAGRYGSL